MGRILTDVDLIGFFEEPAAREGLQTRLEFRLGSDQDGHPCLFRPEKQVYASFSLGDPSKSSP